MTRDPKPAATRHLPALLLAAALVAGLALPSAPAQAESRLGTGSASARLDFRIVIPPVLRLKTLHQPTQVVVTERDVQAGFVDLPDGMAVEVVSNLRAGHSMMFQVASAVVKAVEVTGLGAPVSAGAEAAMVSFPRIKGAPTRTVHNLGFRLRLAPGAAPGTYQWPVALTLLPA